MVALKGSNTIADTQPPAELVVVGSSAGGIEALSTLVAALPANFPAPIVIAQHIDPARVSHLGQILGRRSKLPVRNVADQAPLEPGTIYVIPANLQVEIADGLMRVHSDGEGRSHPSVDVLLSSAAAVYGERLIAVILTGQGSDGAAGARDVSAAGGTVIIQNPETAPYPSMPQSLAPTTVDIIADIENIGGILYELLTDAQAPIRPTEERALRSFLEQLRARSGIDFTNYKTPTIMRRLQRRMIATGSGRLTEYMRFLQNNPDEYQRLVSSFLIKVTEFFRDADLFAHLRGHILPELIEQARANGNELRLWSAGCATGEEAYSLAILISELLGEELRQFNVRIFATDLDNEAIIFARRGVYPAGALGNIPAPLIERYFMRVDDAYEIRKQVRALTIFGQHDLGQRAPFPRIDLELCRNVLIYFTPELQRRALQLFTFSLRDGGYLVLGKAETTNPLSEYFTLDEPRLKVYRRQGERTLFPPATRYREMPAAPPLRMVGGPRLVNPEQSRTLRETQRTHVAREKFEGLLLNLPLGVVVVDRRYDIQAIDGAARRFFGIHGAGIGDDFLHLVQTMPPAPLRAAVDAALRGDIPVTGEEVATTEMATGTVRYLELACYPQKIADGTDAVDAVLITVQDTTEKTLARTTLEESLARQRAETERLTTLMKRLAEANRQLLDANQDLSNRNAEFRSANEEFLVANEEAQAATEEIETLNEELQATNEELETLNEELQATVEELNTTNDDLQARTVELQDAAISLDAQRATSESERKRLDAILGGIGDAVLVVDHAGTITMVNARFSEFFGSVETPFPVNDEHGDPLPKAAVPQQRAARGESFSMQFTTAGADGNPRWFEANGQPIQTDGERGGVIVIRDITDRSLRRLQDEFLAVASHELRTPLTGLSGYLQMLARLLPTESGDERPRKYAAQALEQTQRLTALIGELLDVARLQSGKLALAFESVALAPLVRRVIDTTQMTTTTQTIALEVEKEPLTVQADDRRLEQVILNLLTNAINYAPTATRIDVRLCRAGDHAEIDVQDYGQGITETELPHIFSRFYRVERSEQMSSGGLGLGLYIAHQIVAAHGGTLNVHSVPGEGTTFTVRLPLGGES